MISFIVLFATKALDDARRLDSISDSRVHFQFKKKKNLQTTDYSFQIDAGFQSFAQPTFRTDSLYRVDSTQVFVP